MNVLSWSIPFVAEKVTELFFNILSKGDEEGDDESESGVEALEKGQKSVNGPVKNKFIMKNKIKFVSKVLKMQRVLREESENILKIKALNNDKLPQGILLDGKEALEAFTAFKKVDSNNERRPY